MDIVIVISACSSLPWAVSAEVPYEIPTCDDGACDTGTSIEAFFARAAADQSVVEAKVMDVFIIPPPVVPPVFEPETPVVRVVEHAGPAQILDSFDDVVALRLPRGGTCSGVLVDERLVLTAAHCASATHALFGGDISHPRGQVAIRRFDREPNGRDAGLATLEHPVPLPFHERQREPLGARPTGLLRLVGFGANVRSGGDGVGRRRHAAVLVDGWTCSRGVQRRDGCDPAAEIVLADALGADTCVGDSGGPVFQHTDGTLRLIGVTSRGLVGRTRASCGQGGIYVRVDVIGAWIDRQIKAADEGVRK